MPRPSDSISAVKNPLAGIRGAVQVLGQRLSEGGAADPVVTEIIDRIDSLDQMMMDMLLFARPPTPRCAPTDIAPLVTNTVNLLSQDPALKGIEVEVEGGAPPVLADAEMLRVVFQNLLLNGAHAMHDRGTIRVAVTAVDASCQIAFSDSGPGIPPDVRDRIFTPFFTTKSRGSGLGLPTVKRLVEAHQGEVSIECPRHAAPRWSFACRSALRENTFWLAVVDGEIRSVPPASL